ncbi:MAG: TRAP transporter permease, partial [Allorhizobium sp.]
MTQADNISAQQAAGPIVAQNVDDEPVASNQRLHANWTNKAIIVLCIAYTAFHIGVMNLYPLETWTYRLIHVCGGLLLGFLIYSAVQLPVAVPERVRRNPIEWLLLLVGVGGIGYGFAMIAYAWGAYWVAGIARPPAFVFSTYGLPLLAGTAAALLAAWFFPSRDRTRVDWADYALGVASIAVLGYILFNVGPLRLRAGTAMAQPADFYAALVGVILILEVTRRVAGLALVVIASIFILYSFAGPYLPGFLAHRGYEARRFFTYIFTDQGILSDPVAVSSTYIILFITFAAFLQASKVGDYFVN